MKTTRMIKLAFLLVLQHLCFFNIYAQQNSILKGRVFSEDDNPLPGANVSISDLHVGAITDADGFYTLLRLFPGNHKVSVSYIGYQSMVDSILIPEGNTVWKDFKLKPGILIGQINIGASLLGQAKALNQQKNSPNIMNVISCNQIERFPDVNLGDALKRVAGVYVQDNRGEARYGSIRGTESRLNSVTINGDRIPSAEGDSRSVQLDLIPANIVQSIELYKTITPDMDGDAIGGAVNLILQSNPVGKRITFSGGSGYNFLARKPIWTGSVMYANRFLKDKLGFCFNSVVYDHKLGSDDIEAEWTQGKNGEVFASDFQVRTYYLERLRQSYSASFDYVFNNNNKIFSQSIYSLRDDWQNRYQLRYAKIRQENGEWISEIRRENKMRNDLSHNSGRLEEQSVGYLMFGGNHLAFDLLKIGWTLNYSKAKETVPNELNIGYRAKDVRIITGFQNHLEPQISVMDNVYSDLNNFKNSSNENYWSLQTFSIDDSFTSEQDVNGRIDFELPIFSKSKFMNSIKFGGRFRLKDKIRDNLSRLYNHKDNVSFNDIALSNLTNESKDNFMAGNYSAGSFISPLWAGDLDLKDTLNYIETNDFANYIPYNFLCNEQILAGYLMLNQKIGENLNTIVGLRVEQTSIEYEGFEMIDEMTIEPTSGKDKYIKLLPAFILKYQPKPNTVLRAAYTNTLARPNYYDLVPYRNVNMPDVELSMGNPNLNPTYSSNFDLMIEQYLKGVGIFTAGAFYKAIKDFIFIYELNDYLDPSTGFTFDKCFRPLNGSNANLLGFEIGLHHQFTYLPGILSGFGVYGNYAYIHSEIEGLPIEGRESEKLEMPGTAKNTFNASFSFERSRVQLRLSINYSSSFLESGGIGESSFYDLYYGKALYLDFNSTFELTDKTFMFFELNNITNQPRFYYQGIPTMVSRLEYVNRKFRFGIKFQI